MALPCPQPPAGGGEVSITDGCTACELTGTEACTKTFVCRVCATEQNACWFKAGGIDHPADVCSECWELINLPEGWDAHLPVRIRATEKVRV